AEPGRSAGPWHKHPAPLFVGVDQGRATVKLAHGAHCEVLEVAEGGGLLEMPGMVHEASNPGHEPLAFYILGFAPSPQPLLTPQPTPAECQNA
ncbi:MAG: cupin domain-containing protein, partial [Acidimicrobiia bacterium]